MEQISTEELAELNAYKVACDMYLDLLNCCECEGLVLRGYCCPHCGSVDPRGE